jgi:outer membrane protein OmpA-like peptidoglycan-associated protein
MKFRYALVAATMMALPLAAKAQPITGLYIGGGVGVNIPQNETAKITAANGASAKGWLKPQVGPAAELSAGWGLGNGLRAEVEGLYDYNSFSGSGQGGKEQKYGAMLNVLYDFNDLIPYVTPYVGVGGGYVWAQEQNLYAGAVHAKSSTEGAWAYQGIVGASVPIVGVPGLAFTADYRFLGLGEARHYDGAAGAVPVTWKLNNDLNHSILIGLRYNFGVAPEATAPIAAPVPASPISRSYLVFFDWDRAVLTDRARAIVSEAAANSTKVQYTRLEVNGYTDTSGTPKYNQGLSVRRAQAVAAELVKDGVPKAAISIQGFGETHLLVQTGANVREPQNRRVEIIIK